jgi:isoaspartyl peptidase/L-asparaginase-like protein (Ntn-hydrolase superfamily)
MKQKTLPVALVMCAIVVLRPAHSQGVTEVPDVGKKPEWVIAIHGGAGDTKRESISAEKEAESRAGLQASLAAGAEVLEAGGTGPEAIEAALKVLEDHPLFNAGRRGAVLDETGNVRHDASIMRGEDHAAGAIAGSSRIRNPIAGARAVMEQTKNVLLHGDGADWFAAQNGRADVFHHRRASSAAHEEESSNTGRGCRQSQQCVCIRHRGRHRSR